MIKTNSDIMMAHVETWKNSGMSIRDFAQKIGITKGKFGYWVSKAKALDKIPNSTQFIDLNSLSDEMKSSINSPNSPETSLHPQITLTFPSGLVLKIYS